MQLRNGYQVSQWSVVRGFELAIFTFGRHDFIRLITAALGTDHVTRTMEKKKNWKRKHYLAFASSIWLVIHRELEFVGGLGIDRLLKQEG